MVDLAITIFVILALVAAARLRWLAGLVFALATMATWSLLAVAGWYAHAAEHWGFHGAWMLVALGPSSILARSGVFPLADAIGPYAVVLRAVAAGFALAGLVLGLRRAKQHSPISDAAVRWNGSALAFLPPLLLIGGQVLLFVIWHVVIG